MVGYKVVTGNCQYFVQWSWTQGIFYCRFIKACADEGWNSVHIQLLGNLCRWGVELSTYSYAVQLVLMRDGTQCNIHLLYSLCRWEVEHSTIFICYATWEVELCTVDWNFVQWKFLYDIHGLVQYLSNQPVGESTMWTFFVHIFSLLFSAFPNVWSYPGRHPIYIFFL